MVVRGGRGWGSRVVRPFSLVVVAAFQVFTLNVPSAVVRARELNPVLVHTPADAPFASARWFALTDRKHDYSLDGKVKRPGHTTKWHSKVYYLVFAK